MTYGDVWAGVAGLDQLALRFAPASQFEEARFEQMCANHP